MRLPEPVIAIIRTDSSAANASTSSASSSSVSSDSAFSPPPGDAQRQHRQPVPGHGRRLDQRAFVPPPARPARVADRAAPAQLRGLLDNSL